MGILKGPTGLPSLGLPSAPKRNPRVELPEWKVKISRGWGTSGPAVRGPRDQIDSCLPGTSRELEHWLRRLERSGPGRGRGKVRGRGHGDEHIRRVYPPGSSNSRARHSSSASPMPATGPPGLPPVFAAGGRVLGDPSPPAPREALTLHAASRARGRDRGSERPGVRPIPDRRQRGTLRRTAAQTEGKASRADGDEGRSPGAGARGWRGRGR